MSGPDQAGDGRLSASCRQRHDRLPNGRRIPVLGVVIDQTGVTPGVYRPSPGFAKKTDTNIATIVTRAPSPDRLLLAVGWSLL